MKVTEKELLRPHFGLHLTFDGHNCDPLVLNSRRKVEEFLNSLVGALGMKKLFGPKVIRAKGNFLKDPGGYSGFVIIQESHFSVHTFPKRRFVSIDVYSCRDFDYKKTIFLIKKFFRVNSVETNIVIRGRRYPQKNLL